MLLVSFYIFDTVDHNISLQKLHKYGIRGVELLWFEEYLSNNMQYATYDNHKASREKIVEDHGVLYWVPYCFYCISLIWQIWSIDFSALILCLIKCWLVSRTYCTPVYVPVNCVSIGSGSGLPHIWCQAAVRTSADPLTIGPDWVLVVLREIWIKVS